MYGKGLMKGLKVSLGWFCRKNLTENYPDVMPNLAASFHGSPIFEYDQCIACNQCVTVCPNNVINLETETIEKKKVLVAYHFNMQYCMFCGFCQEACPTDAITFGNNFELSKYNHTDIMMNFVKPEQVATKKENILKDAEQKKSMGAS